MCNSVEKSVLLKKIQKKGLFGDFRCGNCINIRENRVKHQKILKFEN